MLKCGGKKGHLLWNAGQVISEYLQLHAEELVVGKDVLELGAGAGLPSLVCGILGARKVGGAAVQEIFSYGAQG